MPHLISTQISCQHKYLETRQQGLAHVVIMFKTKICFNVGWHATPEMMMVLYKCDHQYETWLNVDMGNCRAEETWNMPFNASRLSGQSEDSEPRHQPIRGQQMSPRTAIMILRDSPPDISVSQSSDICLLLLCDICTGSHRKGSRIVHWIYQI